jgi:hypothetical protein
MSCAGVGASWRLRASVKGLDMSSVAGGSSGSMTAGREPAGAGPGAFSSTLLNHGRVVKIFAYR